MNPSTAFLPLTDANVHRSHVQFEPHRALGTVLSTTGTILMVALVTVVACLFPYFFGRWNGKATKRSQQ